MIAISRTPYRISFLGGGTDHPEWFYYHPGAVLSTTIDKYSYITARLVPPFDSKPIRIRYGRSNENVVKPDRIRHPSVRESLKYLSFSRPVTIVHDGDLPGRTGIGSSSAFTVGLLGVLYALGGDTLSGISLARRAIHVERDLIGECVGFQDQIACAIGGFNHIEFSGGNDFSVHSVEPPDHFADHMMLLYTGIQRNAFELEAEKVKEYPSKEKVLQQMYEMVEEGIALLKVRDLRGFGLLLHEAWLLKRSLAKGVSSPYIDELYGRVRDLGVWGGKIPGAGGGGFMLLFAPPEKQSIVRQALPELTYIPIKLDDTGMQIIYRR